MAVIGNAAITLADFAGALGNDNRIRPALEVLANSHPILDDLQILEGNELTGHTTVLRTALPSGTWRTLNSGALPSKSARATIRETAAILEGYNVMDRDLVDLNGNASEFRSSEDQAWLEGFAQQMAQTIFYGNTAPTPGSFLGVAPRYNSLSAGLATNIIDGGGTGSANASIWLVGHGENTFHGFYPKGSVAGFQMKDVSTEQPVSDGSGGLYQVYQTKFQWKMGIAVRDWRYIVRVANIDATALATGVAAANLRTLMTRAVAKIPFPERAKMVWYMPRAVWTYLTVQANNAANTWLTVDSRDGKGFLMSFFGIPIKPIDQLLTTESRVV